MPADRAGADRVDKDDISAAAAASAGAGGQVLSLPVAIVAHVAFVTRSLFSQRVAYQKVLSISRRPHSGRLDASVLLVLRRGGDGEFPAAHLAALLLVMRAMRAGVSRHFLRCIL